MKIPEVTAEKPYIEFSIDENGKLTLSTTSNWWGGKESGFTCSDGSSGNSCKPQELQEYIEAYYKRKIEEVEEEIASHHKQLEKLIVEASKNLKIKLK